MIVFSSQNKNARRRAAVAAATSIGSLFLFALTPIVVVADDGAGSDTPASSAPSNASGDGQGAVPQSDPNASKSPPSGAKVPGTVVSVVGREQEFTTLAKLIGAAGLTEALGKEGPFTVLAPTNAAFEKLPKGTVETLLKPENKEKLVTLLRYHILPGSYTGQQVTGLKEAIEVKTLDGDTLKIAVQEGAATVNGARVQRTDIKADNGLIHAINTVLLPTSLASLGGTSTTGNAATPEETPPVQPTPEQPAAPPVPAPAPTTP